MTTYRIEITKNGRSYLTETLTSTTELAATVKALQMLEVFSDLASLGDEVAKKRTRKRRARTASNVTNPPVRIRTKKDGTPAAKPGRKPKAQNGTHETTAPAASA